MHGSSGVLPASAIDRRIRHAMRILENEQTPLPETVAVAARVGLSPFHFARLFKEQVGLSPQDYGRSLMMRHAANRLRYSRDPVDAVARDFGYARQATFNKAFTRHHGVAPARWRREAQRAIVPHSGAGVRLERLPGWLCFARRYLGPRSLTALQWADFAARLPPELSAAPRLGWSYDDPRVTPPERIRHDCSVVVEDGTALPEAMAEDGFEALLSPAGLWACVDVAPRDTSSGYRAILDGWLRQHRGYALEGDPHLERRSTTENGEARVTVSMRMRPIHVEGAWNMAVVPPDGRTDANP